MQSEISTRLAGKRERSEDVLLGGTRPGGSWFRRDGKWANDLFCLSGFDRNWREQSAFQPALKLVKREFALQFVTFFPVANLFVERGQKGEGDVGWLEIF